MEEGQGGGVEEEMVERVVCRLLSPAGVPLKQGGDEEEMVKWRTPRSTTPSSWRPRSVSRRSHRASRRKIKL